MEKEVKILGGAAIIFGGSYYITYRRAYNVLKNCRYDISRVFIDTIDNNGFVLGIRVKIVNPSRREVSVENGNNLLLYINTYPVARVQVPFQQFIRAKETTELTLAVVAKWNDVSQWWNILLDLANTADLKVAGKLRVNGLSVPVPPISVYQYNIDDIVRTIKNHNM